jgi:poly(A) polymerase
LVGQAYQHLLGLRMDRGPLPHEEAIAELHAWAAARGIAPAQPAPAQPGSADD